MGSLASSIVANLCMKTFWKESPQCCHYPLPMDEICGWHFCHPTGRTQSFLEHINKVDPAINCAVESNQQDGAIPFLNTIVKHETDNTLSLIVYRKPMHTDQYLQWDSHHNLVAKYSVISTLTYRARTVCIKPELLNQEIQHLRKALTKCKYPKWALYKVERWLISNNHKESNVGSNQREQCEGDTDNPSSNPEGRDSTKEKYKEHVHIHRD